MEIFLIRHGESVSDVKKKYEGDYDDQLTKKGLREAINVAEQLADKDIQIIYSSSKIRAIETSELLSNYLNSKVTVNHDLVEQDIYNAYVELGKEQPEEEYRKLGEILATHEAINGEVETYRNFKKRILKAFGEITNSGYEHIAIVTHGGPIRCIFREILGVGEVKEIGNGSIIELQIHGSCVSISNMTNTKIK